MDLKIKYESGKIGQEDSVDYDEIRIKNIQIAFQCSENIKESCYNLLDSVEGSLEYLKEKRDNVSAKLGDALAKKESLRKKDYNNIISEIYSLLEDKESKARYSFMSFIEDQNELTHSLKNILLNISDYSEQMLTEKKEMLKTELGKIAELQECRKDTVIKILTEFQEIHKKVMIYFESLLEKGENISIKDIKNAKYIIIREQSLL